MELKATHAGLSDTVRSLASHHLQTIFAGCAEVNGIDVESNTRICTLQGHTASVYSLCVIDDSNILVSGSADKSVKIWDLLSHKCIRTLNFHADIVRAALCHPTYSRYLYTGGFDHIINVLDTRTWNCAATSKPGIGNINYLLRDDYSLFAAGSQIAVFDASGPSPALDYTLKGHKSEVTSLSFYGDSIVSGSTDAYIKMWQKLGPQYKCVHSASHESTVSCVVANSDTNKIFSGGADIKVWDIESMYLLQSATDHAAPIRSLAICNDVSNSNTILASGSQDKSVKIWKVLPTEDV